MNYKNAVCRGSWALRNNCRTCERCIETRPANEPSVLEKVHDDLKSQLLTTQQEFKEAREEIEKLRQLNVEFADLRVKTLTNESQLQKNELSRQRDEIEVLKAKLEKCMEQRNAETDLSSTSYSNAKVKIMHFNNELNSITIDSIKRGE